MFKNVHKNINVFTLIIEAICISLFYPETSAQHIRKKLKVILIKGQSIYSHKIANVTFTFIIVNPKLKFNYQQMQMYSLTL